MRQAQPKMSSITPHVRADGNGALYLWTDTVPYPTDYFEMLIAICRHLKQMATAKIFFTKGHLLAGCGLINKRGQLRGTTETGYEFYNEFTSCMSEFRIGKAWREIPPTKCYLPVVVSALIVLANCRGVGLTETF